MFALVIGQMDNLWVYGVDRKNIPLFENFLLAYWLQIGALLSANGGPNGRAKKIIDAYTDQVLKRTVRWLIHTGQMPEDVEPIKQFQVYVTMHTENRRREYDDALRKRLSMQDVADVALPHLSGTRLAGIDASESSRALGDFLHSILVASVAQLEKVLK